MKRDIKRKPPSRVRYEDSHPTVSCRVQKELYERLQKINKKQGRSFADILKVGVGVLEVKVAKEEVVRKRGYDEGYKKGYGDARSMYAVGYLCNVCGGVLTVSSEEERKAIKSYMKDHAWGHGSCHEKRQSYSQIAVTSARQHLEFVLWV